MIFDFNPDVDRVLKVLNISHSDITSEQVMELMAALAMVFDKGMGMERSRAIDIVQRLSMNAPNVVAAIRKPIR